MSVINHEMQPKYKPFFDPDRIAQNRAYSERFDLKKLTDETPSIISSFQKVAIICPGVTLYAMDETAGKHRNEILDARTDVLKVVAGSGHRALNQGKLSHAHIAIGNLPIGPFETDFNPPHDIPYILATHCPPEAFRHLIAQGRKDNILTFNAHVDEQNDFFGDKRFIATGSGAGAGALSVMHALGHREFEFYGTDGSTDYAPDISDLPGYVASLENPENQVAIRIDGRVYTTHKAFWAQTLEIADFVEARPEIKVHFHGESLNTVIFNTPDGKPRRDYVAVPGRIAPPPPQPGGIMG